MCQPTDSRLGPSTVRLLTASPQLVVTPSPTCHEATIWDRVDIFEASSRNQGNQVFVCTSCVHGASISVHPPPVSI